MKRIGYTAPRTMGTNCNWKGGFVLPVYGSAKAPCMAVGEGTIEGFCIVSLQPDSIRPVPAVEISVGQTALFGFESRDGAVVFGGYEEIAPRVRAEFAGFDDLPFTQIDMASFLGDAELGAQALARCAALCEKDRPGAGARFLECNPFRPMPRLAATG